jgi:hypothetical protein
VASGALCDRSITNAQAKQFLDRYCTDCHASSHTGADRHGAPSDITYDNAFDDSGTLRQNSAVIIHGMHADEMAAGGPAAVNTDMPPPQGSPDTPAGLAYPTDDERRTFGSWLACQPYQRE